MIDLCTLAKKFNFYYGGMNFFGEINDDFSHGDVTIRGSNGRYIHFTWLVVPNPPGGSTPNYYSSYGDAVAEVGLFNDNFDQYNTYTLTDMNTGASTTFAAEGMQPSDMLFPFWDDLATNP